MIIIKRTIPEICAKQSDKLNSAETSILHQTLKNIAKAIGSNFDRKDIQQDIDEYLEQLPKTGKKNNSAIREAVQKAIGTMEEKVIKKIRREEIIDSILSVE